MKQTHSKQDIKENKKAAGGRTLSGIFFKKEATDLATCSTNIRKRTTHLRKRR
jgi:hypothetical protein